MFIIYDVCVFVCIVCFVSFSVLFVCKCVLCYCHRMATQLQLTNISYHIISYHIISYQMYRYNFFIIIIIIEFQLDLFHCIIKIQHPKGTILLRQAVSLSYLRTETANLRNIALWQSCILITH